MIKLYVKSQIVEVVSVELIESLSEKIKGRKVRIVFPEGSEPRILGAVVRLASEDLIQPVLIGNPEAVKEAAKNRGFDVENIEIIDPSNYDKLDEMVASFVERRKGKVTEEKAIQLLKDENYFGTMLTYMGLVDGLVSGAIHSTGDTVRPALQIIKTKPGVSRTSGAFIMMRGRGQEKYLFSDCAINVNPNAQELAEIAVESAKTAEMFGIEPKVAMLSFSTKGSAVAEEATKVAEATKIAQELAPQYDIDGEMQFDAAFVASVAEQKAPDSKVAGQASVFVFPELQSGNIGYKIAQRFGNFEAIGPILQGLNKPISDLSRGCNEEDVYKLAIITANQTLMN
ncbi:MAG: phosphate acetyltransferase [Carnobacterium sp.]|nr:phosphate acetyltransferase [Carnobacterium inhibens]MDN5373213.1 phosphate acetyltransferase [Carnobacterium sp.]